MMGASNGSNRSVHAGRDLQVKVNLPTFKGEKSKDVVTKVMLMAMGCGHLSLICME